MRKKSILLKLAKFRLGPPKKACPHGFFEKIDGEVVHHGDGWLDFTVNNVSTEKAKHPVIIERFELFANCSQAVFA